MVDTKKDKYVILEIIPTSISPTNGQLVQLSAIKLNGLDLMDRFDYRLNEDKIDFKKIIEIISYDKNDFKYLDEEEKIYQEFFDWIEDLPLLFIDNLYTRNYLDRYNNHKESILDHLNEKYQDDIIEKLMDKYGLQPSNYIVDLLYESLIYESNKKN